MFRSRMLVSLLLAVICHLRCQSLRSRDSLEELSKLPGQENTAAQTDAFTQQSERLAMGGLLERCARAVQVGLGAPEKFCFSFKRMDRARKYIEYSLKLSIGCLPENFDSAAGDDWDEENDQAAVDIIAQRTIQIMCPTSSENLLEWDTNCIEDITLDMRSFRKSYSLAQTLCVDNEEGSDAWNQHLRHMVDMIKGDKAYAVNHDSCYAKLSQMQSLQFDQQEEELTSLAATSLRGFCQREAWSPQPAAGCRAVDPDLEQCANGFIRWLGDSAQARLMGLICDGNHDFDGVLSGMTRVQNHVLYNAGDKSQKFGVHGVPAECLEDRRKLVKAVGSAFQCSCRDKPRLVPLENFPLSRSALQLLPCVGMESETTALQLKTKQRQVLELSARSMCNPQYPLFQITGDLGDDWRTVELISGPVHAVPEILRDMHKIYKMVLDLLLHLGQSRTPIQLVAKSGTQIAVYAEFESIWRKHVPRMFKSFGDDMKAFLGSPESLMSWLVSKTETGRERSSKDLPVQYAGTVVNRNNDPTIGLQATFEVPLEYGRDWDLMENFFLGTRSPDHGKSLSKSIRTVATVFGDSMVRLKNTLFPLLASSTSRAGGILATILHFLAHFALQQANDNAFSTNHTDQGIDAKVLACDVATKNLMVLNPRFSLPVLFKELDDQLHLEGDIHLWDTIQSAFKLMASTNEWARVSAQLDSQLRKPGIASVLCVKQVGLTDCHQWIGTSRKPSSYVGSNSYSQNIRRYNFRVNTAAYQTLKLVAAGPESWGYVRGCGHDIEPVIRKEGVRSFARFEDRGSGRLVRLLHPDIHKNQMVLPDKDQQKAWKGTNLGNVLGFDPFELASSTLLRPTVTEFGRAAEA